MAEWVNIFDLGDWELYVRFLGVSESPSPDSRNSWVKASELDPSVGTVEVINGEVICDFQNMSGSGGTEVSIVAMPLGWEPETASARMSGYSVDNDGDRYPFIGDDQSSEEVDLGSVDSIEPGEGTGEGTYIPIPGSVFDVVPFGEEVVNRELSGQVPSGEGLMITKFSAGF